MENILHCCICQKPVVPPYHLLSNRVYCDQHYARLNVQSLGFWRAGIFQVAAMVLFSVIVAVIAEYLGPLEHTPLIIAGLFLALVPSALWMIYFYQQDRLEPEPKSKIAEVFLLAVILADVIGFRVIYQFFQVRDWSGASWVTSVLSSILIIGFTFAAIKYYTIRLVVYASQEFDTRMDGIIYGTIAGLGVATLVNLHHILDNQGVSLGPGVIYTVTTALAQASFGGVMGYFMAQAKFEHKPVWWIPLGVSIAALLDGVFSWLIDEASSAGLTVDPWRSLIVGIVVAISSFVGLVWLIRRATVLSIEKPNADV